MASFSPLATDYRKAYGDPRLTYAIQKVPSAQPRAVVVIYGIRTIPRSLTVTLNAHGVADTASVVLSNAGNPDWSAMLKNPTTADGSVVVEIYIGFPQNPPPSFSDTTQLTRVFLGTIDPAYTINATADTTTFEATSFAALLQVDKYTTLVQGMTTTQFVQAAAANANLGSNIALRSGQAPLTLATVFGQDQVVGLHNLRAQDIIEACAEADDVDYWVDQNGVVQYVAPELENRSSFAFTYGSAPGFLEIELTHAPQYAKNIEIEVRLWNHETRTSYTNRAVTQADGSMQLTGTTRIVSTDPAWGTSGSTSTSSSINPSTGQPSTTTTTTSTKTGGLFVTGTTTIPRTTSKERIIINLWNVTPAEADRRAVNEWTRRSRFEYGAKITCPITPDLFKVFGISTCFQIFNTPWHAFNSTAAGGITPNQAAAQGSVGVTNAPFYFQRRTTITFDMPQGETPDGGGLTMTSELLNHAIAGGSSI
jgi:hypothetical protein